jgi:hypothetical protein
VFYGYEGREHLLACFLLAEKIINSKNSHQNWLIHQKKNSIWDVHLTKHEIQSSVVADAMLEDEPHGVWMVNNRASKN